MTDNGQNIIIARDSIKFNPNLLGEQFKATDRFYVSYIYIKYKSSDDFLITLNYRRNDIDSNVKQLSYAVKSTKNYFKKKLPPNITATELWLSISGSISVSFECDSMGVLYDILKVGMG